MEAIKSKTVVCSRKLRKRVESEKKREDKMAENKKAANLGGNIGAGAGIFAKRVHKSFNRAQEKVWQKLGKSIETRDQQFEECSLNLNKQQTDGARLFKDVKAYYNAVKVIHETSKKLSQTLQSVYESDWEGQEDIPVIIESEDLLWNDYEEKLNDQIMRTMENYTSQFPEVRERVAKRGRKLVDYDSARHQLEALQSAKKRDEAKITKAEEEFNSAQSIFEEINKELREELPQLYQSRIGCYVTVFQNLSNLRDVFYKEMSVLNHDLYNVMKKLDTQHSGSTFIIKGLSSAKSKKRKSLAISAPIPCNTAFPSNHQSSALSTPQRTSTSEDCSVTTDTAPNETVGHGDSNSDLESVSLTDSDTPSTHRLSMSSEGEIPRTAASPENGHQNVEAAQSEDGSNKQQENVERYMDASDVQVVEAESEAPKSPGADKPRRPPLPVPRLSLTPSEGMAQPAETPDTTETADSAETATAAAATEESRADERSSEQTEVSAPFSAPDSDSSKPPHFLYRAKALETQKSDDDMLLVFDKDDIILVFHDYEEKPEGSVWGVREEDWIKLPDLVLLSGTVMENLIQRLDAD
ncbi:bridging integrator 2b isoform X1 [Alosa pseudoharengus]|uniref:bridging integrator 2b isoform X1 n=2 Tax=Alosa pseudoharengus TaxID=34774 RepID=UPI003F8B718E